MKITLTKKGKILLYILLAVIVLGSGGYLLWRVLQEESVAPEDSEAGQWQCGEEPIGYEFNRLPTTIGPITEGGTIVLYYKNLLSYAHRPQLTFSYEDTSGATRTESLRIPTLDSNGRAKVVTDIEVPPGGTVTLTGLYDTPPSSDAAWGWEAPNGDQTCGSGLLGPPQGGQCTPYSVLNVSTDIAWAQSDSGSNIVSTQCWADSKEWVGDYDFEDYFLQIGYIPAEAEQCDGSWDSKPEGEYNYCADIQPRVKITDTVQEGTIKVLLNEESQVECSNGETDNCYTTVVESSNTYITLYLNQETCLEADNYTLDISWKEVDETETCNLSTDFIILPEEISENPDWVITKTATKNSCTTENSVTYAPATYNITIRNLGDGSGTIEQVIDQLDSKVLESYITNISNGGSYESGEIMWELDETVNASGTIELSYTIKVPQGKYGTYNNTVTAYPTEGNTFSDDENIELTCTINTTVPETGLLDTVIGRISLGISFMFLGGLVSQYSRLNYFFNSVAEKYEFKGEIRKQKRRAKRRKKLEDRFK
jgi:hypothetical protein